MEHSKPRINLVHRGSDPDEAAVEPIVDELIRVQQIAAIIEKTWGTRKLTRHAFYALVCDSKELANRAVKFEKRIRAIYDRWPKAPDL